MRRIFLKEVPDANRFGVAELDGDRVIWIEEKPFGRGELEITDVNNYYIDQGQMGYKVLDGYWSDAGTFKSLLRASVIVEIQWDRDKLHKTRDHTIFNQLSN